MPFKLVGFAQRERFFFLLRRVVEVLLAGRPGPENAPAGPAPASFIMETAGLGWVAPGTEGQGT